MLTTPGDLLAEDVAEPRVQESAATVQSERRRDVAGRMALPRVELSVLAAALVAFVAFNLAITLDLQPVWLDEVTVADPAVNLYLGRGFTSTGWQYQPKEQFWASNAPLHQILLFHWLKAFKLSPHSVRSMNFVLMAGIILMLWLSSVRMGFVRTWQGRLAMFACLTCSSGLTFNYCAGRYDCIGIWLCVTLLFAFSLATDWQRWTVMVAASVFIPLAGVNLLPYVVLMAGLCVAMFGRRYLRELGAIALGLALGGTFLYILYATNQVVHVILTSAGGHALHDVVDKTADGVRDGDAQHKVLYTLTHLPLMLLARLKDLPTWYTHDRSYVLLALFVVSSAVLAYRRRELQRVSVLWFGAAAALLVPLVLGFARNYPFYYSWMSLIPLSVSGAALVSQLFEAPSTWAQRAGVTALVLGACYWGMPYRLIELREGPWLAAPYRQLDAFLAANARESDCAYADFEPYYGLIARTRYTLLPTYKDMLSEQERSELSLIVVRRQNAETAQQLAGGTWHKVGELDAPEPYDVVAYRRERPLQR